MNKYIYVMFYFTCLISLSSCSFAQKDLREKQEKQKIVIEFQPIADDFFDYVKTLAHKADIGILEKERMDDNDIELRIWGGFGRFGTRGGIIKRKNGQWTGGILDVEYYRAGGTESIAKKEGLLPPSAVELMSHRCVVEVDSSSGDEIYEYSLECPYVEIISDSQNGYANLWNKLLKLEIFSLPVTIEPNSENNNGTITIIADGQHYVVELRIGNKYRVSRISHVEYLKSNIEIGRNVELMATELDKFLGSEIIPRLLL